MTGRLSKKDWIEAGLRLMAEHGAGAVRVERLAGILGVTKGSFYWHFEDRQALLEALIEAWKTRATRDIIDQVEAKGGDAYTKLHTLFGIVGQMDGRLDRAIRASAAEDPSIQTAVNEVDRRRLSFLESLFAGIGFSQAEALARARFVYHALVGQFTMGTFETYCERLEECHSIVLPMLVRKT
ncbi:MAG: TetR/AcrR family transcriptional regulator [Rhodomicrobium sp.]